MSYVCIHVTVDPSVACKNNPHQLLANPVDCAQYYDCSQKTSSMGQDYLKECKYPDLFSPVTKKCQDFQTVKCDKRPEPQAPCKYTFVIRVPCIESIYKIKNGISLAYR